MHLLGRPIAMILANMVALAAAAHFIAGFTIQGTLADLAILSAILTGLNLVVKPLLKLIFGPLIFLTLGLGVIAINAVILYLLDILSENLTIETVLALLLGTVLVGIINAFASVFL